MRFFADEDFDNAIVREVLLRCPARDMVRVQAVRIEDQRLLAGVRGIEERR
jgi:hypothetical protein